MMDSYFSSFPQQDLPTIGAAGKAGLAVQGNAQVCGYLADISSPHTLSFDHMSFTLNSYECEAQLQFRLPFKTIF